MSQPGRSVGTGMAGDPMDLIGGIGGFNQSRYHLNAGKSTYAPVMGNASNEVTAAGEDGQMEKEIITIL